MMTLWLVLIPLIASLIVFFIRNEQAKRIALLFSCLELILGVYLVAQFDPLKKLQFETNFSWIASAGINFHLGIDGIGILPVILTVLLVPFIILSAFETKYEKPNVFYGLILLMQASLVGVFTAQGAFAYYLFWEGALIPVYFLAAIWGGENRIRVTFKFFIYTVFGSLLMLIALVYMYMQTPGSHSDELQAFYALGLSKNTQYIIFIGLFIAFAIKMPVFPFHTWQPDTYTISPTPATMLLSGIMLKMGIYSVIRWLLPVTPTAVWDNSTIVMTLAIIGLIYGAIIAIQQKDIKRLLAYSSFSHVGLMVAGIFAFNHVGLQGAMIQMLAHGINVVGLFFVVDIIQRRTGTRNLADLGGITQSAPVLTVLFAIIMLGSVGLPLTNGFVGEFMLLIGIFKFSYLNFAVMPLAIAISVGVLAGSTLIFGAVYMLRMFQGVMFGEKTLKTAEFKDVTVSEALVLVPLAILVLVMGVAPNIFIKLSEPATKELLDFVISKINK
ncbi:MAG: NADH-quinone oxidoreductase subunit M [Raineya sp.]|nr:NADH-quinone oxidoreductase subunit M [Raineya sp.]